MNLPSPYDEPDCYTRHPLLIVLENYVLACIGELPPDKLSQTQAAVQRILGGGENWHATIRQRLQLEPELEATFTDVWARNKQLTGDKYLVLQPVEFAQMMVKQHFGHMLFTG